jgi:membrane fusion protein, macrolide-specific efflux system
MKIFSLLLACSLLLSGCAGGVAREEATPTAIPPSITPVKPFYTVARGDIVKQVEFSARIQPVVEKVHSFTNSGKLFKLYVRQGEEVQEGQLLAELENAGSEYDLRRAQINLEKARLFLALAELQISTDQPDYKILIAIKQADVDLAQLELDELTGRLEAAQIKASIGGVVTSLLIMEGDEVAALQPVIIISDVNTLEVRADLNDLTMNMLNEGMPVLIRSANKPGEGVDGIIRRLPYPYGQINKETELNQDDQSTRITLQGDWQKPGFELGSAVQVQAMIEKQTDVLWLPPQAVRRFEGRFFVVVQDGEIQRRIDVKIGLSVDDRVEITEGLIEGQLVVAP